jgi:maltose alpha-D-glucosyltransferase/alpha-amylase
VTPGDGRLTSDAGARAAGALDAARLAAIPAERLVRFLGARRWFGAKGRTPRSARIARVLPLPWDGGPFALAVIEVELEGGERWRYQLPLAASDAGRWEVGGGKGPAAVLEERDGVTVFDATEDEAFRAALLASFPRGDTIEGDGARLRCEPVHASAPSPFPLPTALASRVGSAEQSNTSIIYGDAAILKLFRRLEPGENPDVEIARFLTTRTEFRDTPALLGVIQLEDAESGRSVAGMLSRFVPSTGDAWAYTLEHARAYLRAPAAREPENRYPADARELGRVTRALHDALASDENDPDFAPAVASDADVERWAGAAREMMDRAFELLAARAGTLDAAARAPAQALLARRARAGQRLDAIVDEVTEQGDAGLRIRHHGDYHLGQVLRTREGGWMIIDFEGEPARPLAERRALHSPLRDVAGMMRSFAYAAASAAMEAGGLGSDPTVEVRAARWERDARAAFMDGYLHDENEDEPDDLLPESREGTMALLALFEIEKIFYELSYELNNRPAWAWIPLRGIAKLF